MRIQGKVLVITGGGNGIGRALVLEALRRGARVAALDRRAESLDEIATLADAGERLSTHVVDVTDRDRVASLPPEICKRHGAVDGLVNNAGIIQPFVRIADLDAATIDRVFDVNFLGTMHLIRAFLPVLLDRPEGHIANVSSMGGFLPVPRQSIYCATKAAVKLVTEALYGELLGTDVGVSVIMPGAIGTNIAGNSGAHLPGMDDEALARTRTTSPAKAARIILDGIEHNRLHVFIGADARLLNLASRVAPRGSARLMSRVIEKQMKPVLDAKPA